MEPIADIAMRFFDACEMGKGWDACKAYCTPDATFSCQAEALADVKTIEHYTKWMRGTFNLMPDAGYDLKTFAVDHGRHTVCTCAVFKGTFTGQGGPTPPTGKTMNTDYAYVMEFEGDKIRHLTKIWNSTYAMTQIGRA
jgi:ketosteroid isomerase-like protein